MGQVKVQPRFRVTLDAAKKKAKRAAAPRRLAKPCKRIHGALALSVLVTAMWTVAVPAIADSPGRPPAALALPPTLAGESFTQATNDESFEFGCGSFLGRAPDGINSLFGGSMTLYASGAASGPYPGTYTETATLTASGTTDILHGDRADTGTVTSALVMFTITATDGSTVTGSKRLDLTAPSSSCYHYPGPCGRSWRDSAPLSYAAQITTAHGTYRDSGTASATWDTEFSCVAGTSFISTFVENFTASNRLRPTGISQCKKGGWAPFGVFKNQGDCVSFVATGGKNQLG